MRLQSLLAAARAAGLTVRQYEHRVEVGVYSGRVWVLGVAVYVDRGTFIEAHRIDVPLAYTTKLRTVREVAAVFSEYL